MPIVRAALARGPIEPSGRSWRFGRRRFHHSTINVLLASGEARRRADGSVVAVLAIATGDQLAGNAKGRIAIAATHRADESCGNSHGQENREHDHDAHHSRVSTMDRTEAVPMGATAYPQQRSEAAQTNEPVHFACAGLRHTACGRTIRATDLRLGAETDDGWIRIAFAAENTTCPHCLANPRGLAS